MIYSDRTIQLLRIIHPATDNTSYEQTIEEALQALIHLYNSRTYRQNTTINSIRRKS